VVVLAGAVVAWGSLLERRAMEMRQSEKNRSLDATLENHLQQHIVAHFDDLFPGWEIFDDSSATVEASDHDSKPSGVRYRTGAGEIDSLCLNWQGDSLVPD
jgi:hypothetical protein